MRFQYLLCLSFLAAAITPALSLPSVSSDVSPSYEARNADEDADLDHLSIRGYTVKPPRQKKTAREVNQRKNLARQAARKNNKPTTPKGPKPQNLKAHTTQQAALARKNDRLQRGRDKFQAAAQAHKDTVGLPGRKESFKVPGERAIRSGTYHGKDVRIANFNSLLFKNNKVDNSVSVDYLVTSEVLRLQCFRIASDISQRCAQVGTESEDSKSTSPRHEG
jgi:hypothetical protein